MQRTLLIACVFLAAGFAASPARAAKWITCPAPPFPTYPSELGATNTPFIQPGHAITVVLNDEQVAASGGFSAEPEGNQIVVTFRSPIGAEVGLAPRFAAAVSASVLTFDFPDSRDEGHDLLVGPVEVVVYAGIGLVARILAENLVAIPPDNDVTALVLGATHDEVMYGAIGADGALWFPAHFQGEPMAMPSCPGDFIFPVSVEIGGAMLLTDGELKVEPLRQLRSVSAYFGDTTVRDESLYGVLFMERIRLMHVADTLGVSICKMNDAVDMVLRIGGAQSWATCESSAFGAAVAASAPVALILHGAPAHPGMVPGTHDDSFENSCSPVPAAGTQKQQP